MRTCGFVTVDVFTDRRFGGNPLAVFPDASGLSSAEMQALAAEFNLSETSFVLPPANPANTARVRIFTPRHELPFAGHPNVGTGFVLAQHGARGMLTFEEDAGLVQVRVEGAEATVDAPRPLAIGPGPSAASVAACAGLPAGDIALDRHPPVTASVGLPFIIAEVRGKALSRAAPSEPSFHRIEPGPWLEPSPALLIYARDGDSLRARMFAPLSGVPEDPATGSANAALAAFLLSLDEAPEHELTITQGDEMGRPSRLRASARRTADGIRARIGGACVPVLRGEALLDR